MGRILNKLKEKDNTGFSTFSNKEGTRLINKDGSFNIVKKGAPLWEKHSIYRYLILTSWTKFFIFIVLFYFLINIIFASLYHIIGVEHLNGATGNSFKESMEQAFFFSSQTFTTVGYGHISPKGFWVNVVASIEAFSGVLIIAVFTGLLYGRFSRPVMKLWHSYNAVIAPHKDGSALMFRVANPKNSILTDVEVEIRLSMLKKEGDEIKRKYYQMDTQISKINFLTLSWTVVHPIDEHSPLYQITEEEWNKSDAEIIILFRAFEDTFSQTVNSWLSYAHSDVIWNAKFESIISYEDGQVSVDLTELNKYKKL